MEVYAVMGDGCESSWLCSIWHTQEEAEQEADSLNKEYPYNTYYVKEMPVQGSRFGA